MDVLPELAKHHDVIVSATASPTIILNVSMLMAAHPQLLIDLSGPARY